MKILYLQCPMGASGDMLTATLASLLPDRGRFLEAVNGMGLSHVSCSLKEYSSRGMAGLRAEVLVKGREEEDHHHHHAHSSHTHRSLDEVLALIGTLAVSDSVKRHAREVYGDIARAEAAAHGTSPSEVHFHEVGSLDAVFDVVSVSLLMEVLAPDLVVSSPVCVGSGLVLGAHGFMPVPAPTTARLLEGVPSYGSSFPGELCTPTGAALLRHFVNSFGSMPAMTPAASGCGLGKRDFPQPNCLRAVLGEGLGKEDVAADGDAVIELAANIDDMTAEDLAFAAEALLRAGALDAWMTPILMKKGRPATMLSSLCRPADKDRVEKAYFLNTTTIGVRSRRMERAVLSRKESTVQTSLGEVRIKTSRGCGSLVAKPELDDLVRIAGEKGIPLRTVREAVSGEIAAGRKPVKES